MHVLLINSILYRNNLLNHASLQTAPALHPEMYGYPPRFPQRYDLDVHFGNFADDFLLTEEQDVKMR